MRPTLTPGIPSLQLSALSAHPGEVHVEPSSADIARRQLASAKRSVGASQCTSQVNAMKYARKAKRAIDAGLHNKRNIPSSVLSVAPATYTSLANTTCVVAPEVTEGSCRVKQWRAKS